MITLRSIIIAWLALGFGLLFGSTSMPVTIERRVNEIDKLFFESTSSRYRVVLFALSRGTPIDPPPTEANFALISTASFSINSHACYSEIRSVVATFKSSNFVIAQNPGYPHWMWRVEERNNGSVFSVLIDDENSQIAVDQHWYNVPPALIESLVGSFLRAAKSAADSAAYPSTPSAAPVAPAAESR